MQQQKSFTNTDFASMLHEYNYNLHPGDIVAGTIFNQESQGFLVDIGANIAGYLPKDEISLTVTTNPNNTNDLNNITREFFILAYNRSCQQLLLSIKRLEYIRAWKRIKQLEIEDLIIETNITGTNKGGLITIVEGIQGFIPKSHLTMNSYKIPTLNHNIKCKLLLVDEKNNQLILSNKKAIMYIHSQQLKTGKTVQGIVTKIEHYGVFIEINGVPALLHISEIGETKIQDIYQMFKIGEVVKVKILHIDMEQGRLSVSKRYIN